MKLTCVTFLILLVGITFQSKGSFVYQSINYEVLDEESKTCATTASGSLSDTMFDNFTFPAHPKDGDTEYTLVEIADYTLGEAYVRSITIPNTVKKVGRLLSSSTFRFLSKLTVEDGEDPIEFSLGFALGNCIKDIYIGRDWKASERIASFFPQVEQLQFGEAVRNIPAYAFHGAPLTGELSLPSKLESIGEGAFSSTQISGDLILPPTMQSIAFSSFGGCDGILKCLYPSTVPNAEHLGISSRIEYNPEDMSMTDDGCMYNKAKSTLLFVPSSMEGTFVIPSSVTSLGKYAFKSCDQLTSISFPSSLTYIGESCFSDCKELTGEIKIPEGVTNISHTAFENCGKITNFNLPESLNYIGVAVFENCVSLTSITIPEKVSIIYPNTFKSCTSLSEIILPTGLKSIGSAAFKSCSSLTSIDIPQGVTTISQSLFQDCTSLTEINFSDGTSVINNSAFQGCSSLTSIYIPQGVTTISQSLFQDCSSLTEVNFLGAVSAIESTAFRNCLSLRSIELPQGVTSVSDGMFQNCSSLTDITLLGEVSKIGIFAFQGCDALKNLVITQSLLPSFDATSFSESNYNTTLLSIQEENFKDYLTSSWIAFRNLKVGNQLSSLLSDGIFDYLVVPSDEVHEAVLIKGNYSGLHSATIPERFNDENNTRYNITMIAQNAFNGCSNLSSLTFSPRSKVEYIGDGAFSGCTGIRSLELPVSLTTISKNAFNGCSSIETAVFGENIEEIGEGAFAGCEALKAIKIPQGVTEIKSFTFSNTGLNDLLIPASVEKIADSAFANCKELTSITLEDSEIPLVTADDSFSGAIALSNLKIGRDYSNAPFAGTGITTLTIEHKASVVNENAYKGCNDLEDLSLGINLKSIGDNAFEGCSSLTELVVPPYITEIGINAFADVPLTTISLGHSLVTVGDKAFYGAEPETVAITAQVPPAATNTVFMNYSGALMVDEAEDIQDLYADSDACWYRFLISPLKGVENILTDDEINIRPVYGETMQLHATVYPEDATLPHIFWHSTNTDVVKVDNNGVLTFCGNDEGRVQTRSNEPVKIIASTLHHNGPTLEFTIGDTATGVNEIVSSGNTLNTDDDAIFIYDINGRRIDKDLESLSTGIYIVKSSNKTYKLIK